MVKHDAGYSRAIMQTALRLANPCKCGKQPDYNEGWHMQEDDQYRGYNAQCYSCGIAGPKGNIADAIEGWNQL